MHPGLASLPGARRVLVLGGGDGLAVREILKYPQVERITLVDLDPRMTGTVFSIGDAARAECDALASPKLTSSTPTACNGWKSPETLRLCRRRFPRSRPITAWASFIDGLLPSAETARRRNRLRRGRPAVRRCHAAKVSGPWSPPSKPPAGRRRPIMRWCPASANGFIPPAAATTGPGSDSGAYALCYAGRIACAVPLSRRHGAGCRRAQSARQPESGALRARVAGAGAANA